MPNELNVPKAGLNRPACGCSLRELSRADYLQQQNARLIAEVSALKLRLLQATADKEIAEGRAARAAEMLEHVRAERDALEAA
jgi:hypothetical protein